ncbi:MAG: PIN domain-containing protein [Candidatus Methanoperedens sp.]|nr:PIN domain-containing protein [Candidatus Methanoperedens sp.]
MGLNLVDIPDRTEIYIDANILLFSAFKHPRYGDVCKDFLMKMEGNACTSDFTINEVFHKLMIAEISKMFDVRPKDVVNFIKNNPAVISELQSIWEEMGLIAESKIRIISYGKLFPNFIETSKRYNLMATDAIIVEIMKLNGLKNIATNDSDFERIEGTTVWKP